MGVGIFVLNSTYGEGVGGDVKWGTDKEVSKEEAAIAKKKRRKKPVRVRQDTAGRPAVRESQDQSPIATSPEDTETRLTKNWGGARESLSNKGVDLAVIHKHDFAYIRNGAFANSSFVNLLNLDVRSSFDFDKMASIKGLTGFAYFIWNKGRRPSLRVGDVAWTDNIESPASHFRLFEGWLQYNVPDVRVSILAGIHDLNSEFYITDSSLVLMNSSFGIGYDLAQTGVNGPSIFPYASPALRLRVEPNDNFYLQTGIFRAVAGNPQNPSRSNPRLRNGDGNLLISEFAWTPGKGKEGRLAGKYGLGYWTYTNSFADVSDTVTDSSGATVSARSTNYGAYILMEQNVSADWAVFNRIGFANQEVNTGANNWNFGATGRGIIPKRTEDIFSAGISRIQSGSHYRAAQQAAGTPSRRYEIAYEVTYRAQVVRGIYLQPNVQWVTHPGFSEQSKAAKVYTMRLEINL